MWGPGLLAGASEPEENKFDGVDGTQANIKASGSVDLLSTLAISTQQAATR